MINLTKEWYAAVVAGCRLDPRTFRLAQSGQPLGDTSQTLWSILDSLPPVSSPYVYDPVQTNTFSSVYGNMILNLQPDPTKELLVDLGRQYLGWTSYLASEPPLPPGGVAQLFASWAAANLASGQAASSIQKFGKVSRSTITEAIDLWLSAGPTAPRAYTTTIQAVRHAIPRGSALTFSHTFASGGSNGEAVPEVTFFVAPAQDGACATNATAANAALGAVCESGAGAISASFERLVTITAAPLSRASNDPILSQYKPWFSFPAFALAYQNNDARVWNATPPTWEQTFGKDGALHHLTTSLVIVDGVTIELTVPESPELVRAVTAARPVLWPVASLAPSPVSQQIAHHVGSGTMTLRTSSSAGNPQLLGVNITPVANLFS